MRVLPKVLVINQPFNSQTGGGITLTNLFSDWDKDKIAVVCPAYLINDGTQTTICENYYQLGTKEHRWSFPFKLLARKYFSGPISLNSEAKKKQKIKKSALRVNFIKNYLNPLLEKLGFSHGISRYLLSEELKEWLAEFGPDIIYAQAQRRENLLFCNTIQQYLGIPMVFHMMDDWVEFVPKGILFGKNWHKQIDKDLKNVLANSALHLSISDLMGKEYARRYGYEFKTFHNPINLDFWKKGQKTNYELPDSPEILYAGRIGLGISDSLKLMAKAVNYINKKRGLKVRFVIQANQKEDWMSEFDVISHRSFVEYSELPNKFGDADLLFLPYEFSSDSIKFFQYSMPTKASEYMISGTPILIVAPEDTALVQYAKRFGWAEIVSKDDFMSLTHALEELIINKEKRQQIGTTAIRTAEERHDGKIVRQEFMHELSLLSGLLN
jgi:glycosyltransferase involved in cell wall biosynthesis